MLFFVSLEIIVRITYPKTLFEFISLYPRFVSHPFTFHAPWMFQLILRCFIFVGPYTNPSPQTLGPSKLRVGPFRPLLGTTASGGPASRPSFGCRHVRNLACEGFRVQGSGFHCLRVSQGLVELDVYALAGCPHCPQGLGPTFSIWAY